MPPAYKTKEEASLGLTSAFNPTNEAQRQAIAFASSQVPITPAQLAPEKPIQLPTKPPLTMPTVGTIPQLPAGQEMAPAEPQETDWIKQLFASTAQPPSASDTYGELYKTAGIDQSTALVNEQKAKVNQAQGKLGALNAQLAQINAEAQAIPIQIQQSAQEGGANVTKGGLAPITTAALRNNALKAIPLQAQVLGAQAEVALAQGNQQLAQDMLEQAQTKLDNVFQIHMQDAQNQYNYQKELRDRVYDYATKKEQRELDRLQKEDDRKFAIKQDQIGNAQALSQIALESGQSGLAGQITALDPNSPTFTRDLANLQSKIIDTKGQLQRQLIQEQIITQRANRKDQETDRLIELAKLGDVNAKNALGITTEPTTKITLPQKEAAALNKEITTNDNWKAIDKSMSSWRALKEYEKLVKDIGAASPIMDPIDTGKARAVWNTALLNLKEYYNLGVLNGPDLEIMQQLVPSNVKSTSAALVSATPGVGGITDYVTKTRVLDAIANQKTQFEDKLDTDYLTVRNQYREYSPEQLTNLQDLDRKYLQMKAELDPAIATFLKENPNMPFEDILSVINTRL